MQSPFTLFVFGSPRIQKDKQETVINAPLPVLVATYVVVEHEGEAKSREAVCNLFYPIDFEVPFSFYQLTKNLYKHFWIILTEAQTEISSIFVEDEAALWRMEGAIPSENAIQAAHEELINYRIITEEVKREENGWRYTLNRQLIRYLNKGEYAKNGRNKAELTKKVFSEHVSRIREQIRKRVDDKVWKNLIPKGESGKKIAPSPLIINFTTEIPQLQNALKNLDLEAIQQLYPGAFLADIEKNIQKDGKWFFPPRLYCWLLEKRTEFDALVGDALVKIIGQTESIKQFEKIRDYGEKCGLHHVEFYRKLNEAMSQYISGQDENNIASTFELTSASPAPIVISPNLNNEHLLPNYLRSHLLNKIDDECEIKLKATDNKWMETYLTVSREARWSETGLNFRDSKLLVLLFEKSYGFAVLLGEGGIGKSVGLCYLAQVLVKQAKIDFEKPVPLFLHLADWAQKAWTFESWLKFQLVRLGLAENNIDAELNQLMKYQQCILLLDGFDNLPPIERPFYLQQINDFIIKYGEAHLGGVILASRTEEYNVAKEQCLFIPKKENIFYFQTEATLLRLKQVYTHNYLTTHSAISSQLAQKLLEMDGLKEFLNIPLGLTLFIHNTQNQNIDFTDKSDDIKTILIENYVKKQFESEETSPTDKKTSYSNSKIHHWLGYIARYLNMGDTLYLENLTPQILNARQQSRYQILFLVFFSIIFGVAMGGVAGLMFGERIAQQISCTPFVPSSFLSNTLNGWIEHNTVMNKLSLVSVYAMIGMLTALFFNFTSLLLFRRIYFPFFLSGYLAFFMGFTGWLVDGSQWSFFSTLFYGTLGILC